MPRSRLTIAALATAGVAVLSACSPSSQQSASTAPPAATSASGTSAATPVKPPLLDPTAVDISAPEQVAEAVAIASVTWDTTVHGSEYDAIRSVDALLTAELAAAYAPVSGEGKAASDPMWATARDLDAYNIPDVRTAQANHHAPPDTATTIYRTYDATWTWHGTGGEMIHDPRTRYLYLTIALQPDGRWLVSSFDVADI